MNKITDYMKAVKDDLTKDKVSALNGRRKTGFMAAKLFTRKERGGKIFHCYAVDLPDIVSEHTSDDAFNCLAEVICNHRFRNNTKIGADDFTDIRTCRYGGIIVYQFRMNKDILSSDYFVNLKNKPILSKQLTEDVLRWNGSSDEERIGIVEQVTKLREMSGNAPNNSFAAIYDSFSEDVVADGVNIHTYATNLADCLQTPEPTKFLGNRLFKEENEDLIENALNCFNRDIFDSQGTLFAMTADHETGLFKFEFAYNGNKKLADDAIIQLKG